MIPIILCLAFAVFFQQLSNEITLEKYIMLFNHQRHMVDLTAIEINQFVIKDDDWIEEQDFYLNWLYYTCEIIGMQDMTISMLADNDLDLLLANNLDNTITCNPFEYEEFIDAVRKNPSGAIVLPYNNTEISIYYRWIPDNNDVHRFLLISGAVFDFSNPIDPKYNYGIAILLIFVMIVNYVMLGIIKKRMAGE